MVAMFVFLGGEGREYLVEWRHQRYSRKRITAVSTCVIFGHDRRDTPYTAVGTSVCVAEDRFSRRKGEDRFSRRKGREQAFHEALRCRLFDRDRAALEQAFAQRFPTPAPVVPRPKLTPEDRAALAAEGRRRHRELGQGGG